MNTFGLDFTLRVQLFVKSSDLGFRCKLRPNGGVCGRVCQKILQPPPLPSLTIPYHSLEFPYNPLLFFTILLDFLGFLGIRHNSLGFLSFSYISSLHCHPCFFYAGLHSYYFFIPQALFPPFLFKKNLFLN